MLLNKETKLNYSFYTGGVGIKYHTKGWYAIK